MMRLGLVGVGSWGQRYVDRIRRRADCRITAVARGSRASLEAIQGAKSFADWRTVVRLAAGGDVDGVVVATNPSHQVEVAIACATAGVPLLVEKPLGLSESAARDVSRSFEISERKAPIVVDYIHLWAPAFVALKQRLEQSGGASQVSAITTAGCNRGPFRSFSTVYDYGSHDVAMILALLGTSAPLGAAEARRLEPLGLNGELYEIALQIGGVPVTMRVGNGASTKTRRFSVSLHTGRVLVYDDTRDHPMKLLDGAVPVVVDECGPLDAVLSDFIHLIERWKTGGGPDVITTASLALSVRVNEILDQLTSIPK